MKKEEYSEEKAFQQFGNKGRHRKPFELLKISQSLCSEILNASAIADKNYRLTICQKVHHYAYDLIHLIRKGNMMDIGSEDRKQSQEEALENIERLYDLIPVLRMCRCITPKQEGEIEKTLDKIKYGMGGWIKSDKKRMEKSYRKF